MKSEGTIRGSTSRIMRRLDNAWRRWRGAQRTGDRSETWSWRWNTPKAGTEESSEVVKMLNGSTSLDRTVDRLEDDVVNENWLLWWSSLDRTVSRLEDEVDENGTRPATVDRARRPNIWCRPRTSVSRARRTDGKASLDKAVSRLVSEKVSVLQKWC